MLTLFFGGCGSAVTVSPPRVHSDALRAMEKVASHINEMQKIYEDYGSVFDQLAAEQSAPDKQVMTTSCALRETFESELIQLLLMSQH